MEREGDRETAEHSGCEAQTGFIITSDGDSSPFISVLKQDDTSCCCCSLFEGVDGCSAGWVLQLKPTATTHD